MRATWGKTDKRMSKHRAEQIALEDYHMKNTVTEEVKIERQAEKGWHWPGAKHIRGIVTWGL